MKSLLTVLATLSLLTPVVSKLATTPIKETKDATQYASKKYYWKSNHQSVEFISDYGSSQFAFFNYFIDLGKVGVENYSRFSVIDDDNKSYTKTSWGNTAYYGFHFNEFQNQSVSRLIPDRWIVDKNNVRENANIIMLLVGDSSGWASFQSEQRIGLSHYWAGSNFLQIFGYQYAETWTSLSGGSMWMNIGQGIEFW